VVLGETVAGRSALSAAALLRPDLVLLGVRTLVTADAATYAGPVLELALWRLLEWSGGAVTASS
jgi:hypothetical protein